MFQSTLSIAKKNLRFDDEVRFIRSWMEEPLATGAVMPSGKPLARNMPGPIIELGACTGTVTAALVEQGIESRRMALVESNHGFCRLLGARYPDATVVQGASLRAHLVQHAPDEGVDLPQGAEAEPARGCGWRMT
jgi:phosphatidylethanolamine/phosphatidyl-N-methylethanolamine N-methyltransferase